MDSRKVWNLQARSKSEILARPTDDITCSRIVVSEQYSTYILASKRNGALYTGMTEDLVNCVFDHKCNLVPGITSHYAIHQLVYYEHHDDADSARQHESWIKQLHRIWKLELIEEGNPEWRDLYDSLAGPAVKPVEMGLSMLD